MTRNTLGTPTETLQALQTAKIPIRTPMTKMVSELAKK